MLRIHVMKTNVRMSCVIKKLKTKDSHNFDIFLFNIRLQCQAHVISDLRAFLMKVLIKGDVKLII